MLLRKKSVTILENMIIAFSEGYCQIRQKHPFEDKDQQKSPTLPPFSWSVTASANFKFVHHFLQPKAKIKI